MLVDTSIWVEHFRRAVPQLVAALEHDKVVMHPFVVGELACGNLADRDDVLDLLRQLRRVTVAESDEVLGYIANKRLHGRGIGHVDVHLLASASIDGVQLWTGDRRLRSVAEELGLAVTSRTV